MNEMNDILAIVNKREEELIRAIEKAKKDDAIFPDGHLRINNNAGQTRYYKMTKRGDTTGEYLSVKNMDTIRLLAQKDYSRKFLKKAKAELKALHLIRKQLTKECTIIELLRAPVCESFGKRLPACRTKYGGKYV